MAYRESGMWDVLDVLRRVQRGETVSAVARGTGRSRKTVGRYVRLARQAGWDGVVAPSEELAGAVAQELKPGPASTAGPSEERLLPHKARIEAWLHNADDRGGLRLSKVHALLRREGVEVPYSSLHRFAVEHCGFGERSRVTVRVAETAAGETAQIDFGRLGLVYDAASAKNRVAHALCVTLPFSRHQYVHVTFSQRIPELVGGLEDAWAYFGGVPKRVTVDNMKQAVTRSDRYAPEFSRTFAEYAEHRSFTIDAALPRHPQGKPHVERNVQYLRENFFRGERFLDLEDVQRRAVQWCSATAGMRVHGTTGKRPLKVFEDEERAALIPLTKERFDPPHWATCKVHPDHHISFLKAAYTVPTQFVGKEVTVRGDTRLVRVYAQGVLIKTHARQPPGGRSTDVEDYPKHLVPYALRDPARMIADAEKLGPCIGKFMVALLGGELPWSRLRQAQALLRLSNKYGVARLEASCARALGFDLIDVKRVERIVKDALDTSTSPHNMAGELVLASARFLRPAGSFTHNTKES